MISFAILLVIIGFYLLYLTSEKIDVPKLFGFENYMLQHKSISKILGIALLSVSSVLTVFEFGLGAGIFLFFIYLMTFASLIVLLSPLKLFNFKLLFIGIALCFAFEYLVHIP
ncbi:hypothetical protein [Formosa algae]|uniref:Cell division protein FtsW (Lipid II flippase) n=1 Tax=Formosa algae TaxID=225843 RepID=A0A9X1C8M6_9FLAO|nr:hypothetical protein [Formosa algae]MBP1839506.1 cell division protein FtsW (lipid II flippase) [Formosa algae]MDQ0334810.1 cell division protein FtsW (lipid II flippase) [Formosa algae]OEI82054.1 hypothetical protein AST99_01010 [Formosa algae]